ncbi:MAG: arylamine N-acetyltransferase [bacterium]|nr:arylamine N-acetyltransferase [bacterium]
MDPRQRYLAILGVEPAPPSAAYLRRLVRAQLMGVPFENLSKLYRVRRLGLRTMPSLEEHLEGIERFGFGGTCYPNNGYFCALLRDLGFEASLCGADMSSPDVHAVVMVTVEGREYLVDGGYAAPFYEPLPRDLGSEQSVEFGNERYVLRTQDENGRSRLDHYRDGKLIHGYLAKPQPRRLEHFDAIVRASYEDSATFLNAVMFRRFFPERSVTVYNHSLIVAGPKQAEVTRLDTRPALIDAIATHFEIPRRLVEAATADLGALSSVH